MNEKQILESINKSIEQAPIDILDKIKEAQREKMLRHDDITVQDNKTFLFKKLMPYMSAAAGFLLVFFGWQYQFKMPDSHIYLDVNPSIEIVTNRQDKVINVRADNLDGEKITKDLDYKGKTIAQVTEEILDNMMSKKYLDKDGEFLLLSVYNKNHNKAEEQKQSLDKKIHEYLQGKELQPIVLLQKLDNTSTIENYAKKYGISVSKMTFIRNLIILNPELQTEDLVDLSIEELVNLSQGMGLELDKIIESTDFDRIQAPLPEPEPEEETEVIPGDQDDDTSSHTQHSAIISFEQAKSIALSVANGTITDFDFDEDDLEYEVEIELGDLEYEITIDARTGEILEVDIDD